MVCEIKKIDKRVMLGPHFSYFTQGNTVQFVIGYGERYTKPNMQKILKNVLPIEKSGLHKLKGTASAEIAVVFLQHKTNISEKVYDIKFNLSLR